MSVFSPPYMTVGMYDVETRKRIEASNRKTITRIFEQRAKQKRDAEMWKRRKELHDQGMHWPGPCPWCPPNIYYD